MYSTPVLHKTYMYNVHVYIRIHTYLYMNSSFTSTLLSLRAAKAAELAKKMKIKRKFYLHTRPQRDKIHYYIFATSHSIHIDLHHTLITIHHSPINSLLGAIPPLEVRCKKYTLTHGRSYLKLVCESVCVHIYVQVCVCVCVCVCMDELTCMAEPPWSLWLCLGFL